MLTQIVPDEADLRRGWAMGQDKLDEIWNPFGEHVDDLSLSERSGIERGRAWAWYINGGGDPSRFDRMTYMRLVDRER